MTTLEILDTAVKIGLGASITAIATYINQKSNQKAILNKEQVDNNRKIITQMSAEIEDITHSLLKLWSLFDFNTKNHDYLENEVISKLSNLREDIFKETKFLTKNEGILLLYNHLDQQKKLREFGDLVGSFYQYTLFKKEDINPEMTKFYREEILRIRSELYQSLNKAIS